MTAAGHDGNGTTCPPGVHAGLAGDTDVDLADYRAFHREVTD